MKVKKRDGSLEEMRYDKITKRISALCHDLNLDYIDPTYVTLKVTQGIYDGITTTELDNLAAETAASMVTTHPDYAKLSGRLAVSNLHKTTPKKFSQCIKELHSFIEPKTLKESSLISDEVYEFVMNHKETIDFAIHQDRDLDFDFFGFKTLERSYLLKIGDRVVERPQYMYMRVAVGICNGDIDMAIRIYNDLSQHFYTHATPTLFNAGTVRPQMSSCFLIGNKGDDIDGLFDTIKDVAKISKWAGGIGLHVHDVRAKGAYIKGTGGQSDGLLPMMKTYNEVARWINQCFESDTQIQTRDGKKSIGDLTEEDYVLTVDGTFHQVYSNDTFDYNGELLNFETTNGNATLKGDHPMLVIQNISEKTDDEIKKLMKLNVIKPIWIDADKISDKDIILSY
jgi:hypothetical protein